MEQKKCKNKKCQRALPDGFKYKYCENCRNKRIAPIMKAKKIIPVAAGVTFAILTKGKFPKK